MKIRLVGAELFRTKKQKDMTKLIKDFRNFANAPKDLKVFLPSRIQRVAEISQMV